MRSMVEGFFAETKDPSVSAARRHLPDECRGGLKKT